ncbi:lipoate--protein ligase family protein, partial [Mesorhizobium sp. M00.F.Ca.ET.186.01.1.1]
KQRMMDSFRQKAVTINEVSPRPVSLQEAIEAFSKGFASGLDVELVPSALTDEERALAEELAATRYATDEWNLRR